MILEQKMKSALQALGMDEWEAVWTPRDGGDLHGETLLEDRIIMIYDKDEKTAWRTFSHEITELKLRPVTRPYRELINALIETFDKICYTEKERFIDDLPRTLEILNAEAPGGS